MMATGNSGGTRIGARRGSFSGHAQPSIDDLIGSIYEAALEPTMWSIVLERIRIRLNGARALLFSPFALPVEGGFWADLNLPPESLRSYVEHYVNTDVWLQTINNRAGVRPDAVFTDHALLDSRCFEHSEFFNDFLRGFDIRRLCSLTVFDGRKDGYPQVQFSIYRALGQDEFDTTCTAFLARLGPHLRRALQLHWQLSFTALDALDALLVGLILVDKDCRVVHANAAAEVMLARRDGLFRSRRNCLTAAAHDETQRLQHLVAGAVLRSVGKPSSAGGGLAISRPPPQRPLALIVTPLPPEHIPLIAHRPIAMIFVSAPEARPAPSPEMLIALYGLTAAEAQLASSLATGLSLAQVSAQQGTSLNTTRWHLKHVFNKLGVGHQAELVALLSKLGVVVGPR